MEEYSSQINSAVEPSRKSVFKKIGCFFGVIILIIIILIAIILVVMIKQELNKIENSPVPRNGFTQIDNQVGNNLEQPQFIDVVTIDDPSLGSEKAALTIVEFSDFECPFCKKSFPVVREIAAKYPNDVKFIYRDFPVAQIHDNAQKAAEAGACAHEQGKFWPMHDKIFQNQTNITVNDLKRYALQISLNAQQFNNCLDSNKMSREIKQDFEDGIAAGVQGTPTWFFNGFKVEGAIPRDTFMQIVDEFLKELN